MAESRLFLLRKLWIVHTLPAHAESKLGNNRSWKPNSATHKNVRSKSDHVRSTQLEISVFRVGNAGDNVQQTFSLWKTIGGRDQ